MGWLCLGTKIKHHFQQDIDDKNYHTKIPDWHVNSPKIYHWQFEINLSIVTGYAKNHTTKLEFNRNQNLAFFVLSTCLGEFNLVIRIAEKYWLILYLYFVDNYVFRCFWLLKYPPGWENSSQIKCSNIKIDIVHEIKTPFCLTVLMPIIFSVQKMLQCTMLS